MTASIEVSHIRQLAAYIPVTLARRILEEGLPPSGEPHGLTAATLFADVSGFTAMSEELGTDGPRGAEELNQVLMRTFTGLVDIVHAMGGAIAHYYGDAMLVYFPDDDGRAALRALACAQTMQELMATRLSRVVTNRPAGKNPFFELTIKIGVGYGRCQEIVIGQPDNSMEFVLIGAAVDDVAQAEKHASAGQIIASLTAVAQAGYMPQGDYALFDQPPITPPPAAPILDWTAYDKPALARLGTAVRPFIPTAVVDRLTTTGGSLAEHRPASNIFIQVDFIPPSQADSDQPGEAAEIARQLQDYYLWVVQVIRRFGGINAHLSRVLTGDKGNQLHIIFGAPIAPDAPVQAVRCALALQAEQPPFVAAQRIGVTVGKLFAGPLGAPARQEYAVAGAVVNLAARLMQTAPDGKVLLDETTANRVSRWLHLRALEPVKLKGFHDPVTPIQAVGEHSETQLQNYLEQWARPLVGRTAESELLHDKLKAAFTGRGGTAAIYGATGVGKSHLLAAGMRYWLGLGGEGLLGICFRHTADTPYAPWRAIWQHLLELTDEMSVAEQSTAVTEKIRQTVPDLAGDAGLWQEALGLPLPPDDSLAKLTAETRQARLFTLIRKYFQALAAKKPIHIMLEDLHWADQASLKLLDELAGHLHEHAIFLSFTYRADDLPDLDVIARPGSTTIFLTDLSAADGRKLLGQLTGVKLLPQPVERHLGLRDREGRDSPVNPLFLEEALRVMLDAGVLRINGQVKVDKKRMAHMQVPDTIHGLLLARLDRLPADGRDLVQTASVIGREFALEPLVALADPAVHARLLELLNLLSNADVTRLVAAEPEWVYLFQHALTHEVAYESLPFARRQLLHALVADWLEETYRHNLQPYFATLAFHYGRAANEEKCLHFAIQAGDAARAIFANQEAVDLYTLALEQLRALGEEERWDTAVHVYLARAETLMALGNFDTAVADAEHAAHHALTHDVPEQLAQAYNTLAELKWRQANLDESQELSNHIISTLAKQISSKELARAYFGAGWGAASSGQWDTALTKLNHAKQLCLSNNDTNRLALTLEAIAYVHFSRGKLDKALEIMQQSIKYAYDTATPANIALSLSNIGLIQFQLGQPEQALQTFNEAVRLATDTNQNFLALTLGNRAEVLTYLGDFRRANQDFTKAINLFSQMNDESALLEVYLLKGQEYHIPLEEWEEAAHWFAQAQKIIEARQDTYPEKNIKLLVGLARINLQAKAYDQALNHLQEAETIVREKELAWWLPVVLYFMGLTYKHSGITSSAWQHFTAGLEAVSQSGCPDYKALTYLNMAQLTPSSTKKRELLEASVNAAKERARLLDKATCLEQAGLSMKAMDNETFRQEGAKLVGEAEYWRDQVQRP